MSDQEKIVVVFGVAAVLLEPLMALFFGRCCPTDCPMVNHDDCFK